MNDAPQIVTFYSYKGGVGRSMAVLNVAYAMAIWGRNVLVLDMDLEAPGLSGFLKRHKEVEGLPPLDMVDLVSWANTVARATHPIERSALPPASDYIVSVSPKKIDPTQGEFHGLGRVDIVPVDEERDYYSRLTALGVANLDRESLIRIGSVLRSWLKSREFHLDLPDYYGPNVERTAHYDFILVDSRTGVTEIGGLCIGPLSDNLVVLTALNDQNIEGTKRFLTEVGIIGPSDSSGTPNRLDPKPTLMVASPVPTGEVTTKGQRLEKLREAVGTIVVKLSYHPQMALFETIFVRDHSDEYLAQEYLQLVELISGFRDDLNEQQINLTSHSKLSKVEIRREVQRMLRDVNSIDIAGSMVGSFLFSEYYEIPDKEDVDYALIDHACRVFSRVGGLGGLQWTMNQGVIDSKWAGETTNPELKQLRFDAAVAAYTTIVQNLGSAGKLKTQAFRRRGNINSLRGDLVKAISDYTAILETPNVSNKYRAQSLFQIGVIYGQLGDMGKAIEFYTAAINTPNVDRGHWSKALINRANTYGELGKLEDAIIDYTAVIEAPGMSAEYSVQALLNRGVTYRRQGNLTKAIADQTAAIEMPEATIPQKAQGLINRAFVHSLRGELELEIADYTAVSKMDAATTAQRAQVYSCLGWHHFVNGNLSAALDCLQQTITIIPAKADHLGKLAIVLLVSGELKEAMGYFDRALSLATLANVNEIEKDLRGAIAKHGVIANSEVVLAKIEGRLKDLESSTK